MKGVRLTQDDYLRNIILMDSYIREQISEIDKLQVSMVTSNPNLYSIKSSDMIEEFRGTLLPWIRFETKKRKLDDLADIIKLLDRITGDK